MPSMQSSEIVAGGLASPELIKRTALRFGVENGTVRDWRTGRKRNPLDACARYIRFVHPHNPGNARLAAAHLVEICDEMDRAAGRAEAARQGDEAVCASLARKVKESADVVQVIIAGGRLDARTIRRALSEIAEERSANERLEACLRAELARVESEPGAEVRRRAAGAGRQDSDRHSPPAARAHAEEPLELCVAGGQL